ncbi:MAG: AAA family ATPase [Planctomycetes bacterium]|nr:AAA family ATPase [Planctomycetota bacterium]
MSTDQDLKQRVHAAYSQIKERVHNRIVGLDEVIDLLLIGLLSEGHCLLVGVPGLAKTLLISTLSELLDLGFSRIQFTPDLMPSDIVGTEVITENADTGDRSFRFMNGPVFANVILADEINRTPPKTQAALMEAMEELQVTIGGRTHPLARPFFVLATQNPIEQEGTYPLPAAQLDRFTFLINVDYPNHDEEYRIIRTTCAPHEASGGVVLDRDEILALLDLINREPSPEDVVAEATRIARATRPENDEAPDFVKRYVSWGVGPRGAQAAVQASKVRAMLQGRDRPTVEDVHAMIPPSFRHRLIMNFRGEAEGETPERVLQNLIEGGDADRRPTSAVAAGGDRRRSTIHGRRTVGR